MFTVRLYHDEDTLEVGKLIADTFMRYNLASIPSDKLHLYQGPFAHAYSPAPEHQRAIARVLIAEIVYVAEDDERHIAGVLRGRKDKLQSLFVKGKYHRQGIGRQLVNTFEQYCLEHGSTVIKVQASLYAVPFYLALGYKRTTGIRQMTCFKGKNLPYQPMKKILSS